MSEAALETTLGETSKGSSNDAKEISQLQDVPSSKTDTSDDPYAYLERADFTSEKFKIEISGLPKFYGMSELRKLLNEKLQLGSNKVKPLKPGSYWAFVCFRSEEDRNQALKVLNGFKWKGNALKAQVAKPCPDPLVKKRKGQSKDRGPQSKVPCVEGTMEERIKNSVSPLWNLPYSEQLEQKGKAIRGVLLRWAQEVQKTNPYLRKWLSAQRDKFGGLPCELRPVLPSPVLTGYRNKCEFTIGINEDTREPTVGFRIGSYVNGCAGVAPADSLDIVPERMKTAAKVFEQFVRASPLGVFNPETHEGVWRQLLARLSTSGQLMLVVGLHPQSLDAEALDKLRTELHDFFAEGPGAALEARAVFMERLASRSSGGTAPPLDHLLGDTCIYETVCGLTFRISPEAFFQVNTAAAQVLYSTIGELAGMSPSTTVLDICCGTGTIGLCLSKHCDQVLGVEISQKAVEDAKANTERNSITNCEFFAGCAEDLVSAMIQRARNEHIVAVVDPPRAGLHQRAMTHLRNARKLDKLVYVSCDAKAAMNNFILLARPMSKTYSRPPLVPVCAVPVDLFPHTPHCELIIYFERYNDALFSKTKIENAEISENAQNTEEGKVSDENVEKENGEDTNMNINEPVSGNRDEGNISDMNKKESRNKESADNKINVSKKECEKEIETNNISLNNESVVLEKDDNCNN